VQPGEWIAVDWGSTHRRAFRIDAAGNVAARISDSDGVLAIAPGGFPEAAARLRAELGDLPLLMGGMIGSTRGWIEAPYLDCPLDLAGLAARLVPAPAADCLIVPGLRMLDPAHADVMRGEEVQLLGAIAAGLADADGIACLPGTHAKWARSMRGAITGFHTAITGEMFALLRGNGVLASHLEAVPQLGPAFLDGVRQAQARTLLADLFRVRAGPLLGVLALEDASSYASGLLIGSDVVGGLADTRPGEVVSLIGAPALTALYAAAIRELGGEAREIDGEQAFLAGMTALARLQHDPS
jgi:2-dehydro-3-deoxygalactonokinase